MFQISDLSSAVYPSWSSVTQSSCLPARTPPKISEPFPAPPEDETILAIGRQLKDMMSPFPEKQQVSERSSSRSVCEGVCTFHQL